MFKIDRLKKKNKTSSSYNEQISACSIDWTKLFVPKKIKKKTRNRIKCMAYKKNRSQE